MADVERRIRLAAVVLAALLAGTFFFALMTLVNRYLFDEEFSLDAIGPTIAVTLAWIGLGVAEEKGWIRSSRSWRNGRGRPGEEQ